MKIKDLLQKKYIEFLNKKISEIKRHSLTTKITITFNKGEINNIQEQQNIAGVSLLDIHDEKILK